MTTATKIYLERHRKSGLKIGDVVTVTRMPSAFELGWACGPVEEMRLQLKSPMTILSDKNELGFTLESFDKMQGTYVWPYYVLEKVNVNSNNKHTTLNKQTKTTMTPFIFHGKKTPTKNAYTLVGILDETQEIATLSIGLAVCADSDTIDKKLGVRIATGRAEKKPLLILQLTRAQQAKTLQAFLAFVNSFTPTDALFTRIVITQEL